MVFLLTRKYLAVYQDLVSPDELSNCFISHLSAKFYPFTGFCLYTPKLAARNQALQISINWTGLESSSINTYVVRFYLKGIGYKFLRSRKCPNWLRVELGYSVSTYICIPFSVKLFHKRDKLVLVSLVRSKLINFSKQVFQLRPADVYKGKGVRLTARVYAKFKPGKQR